jgi:hypothetical protein
MTPEERRDLIVRLERPVSDFVNPVARRARLGVMIGDCWSL